MTAINLVIKIKLGDFKYTDIKDLVNNIKDNTISETDAKNCLNTLNIIKNSEIEHKKLIPGQKELLNLFKNQKSENYENENEYEDYENKNEYEDYENKNEYEYKMENKNEDKSIDQNKIKGSNDILDETIDKSKSFEEQIKLFKKRQDLEGFYPYNDFGDKELKSKYFKIELAKMSNDIDEKLFEEIFGHTLIKLTDQLINTTNKEKNPITVDSIKKININFLK